MSKKIKDKLPKLPPLKKKLKGKAYVGDGVKGMRNKIKELEIKKDSLEMKKDSLEQKNKLQQQELDSLKQVVKIRIK